MSQDDDKPEGQDERTVELSGVELHALRQSATNLLRVTREDLDALDDSEPEVTEVREDDITPLPSSIIPTGLDANSESDAVDSTRTFDRGSLKDLIKKEVKKSAGTKETATSGILRRGPIRDAKKEDSELEQAAPARAPSPDTEKHSPGRDDPPTVEVDYDDAEDDLDADLDMPPPDVIEAKDPDGGREDAAREDPLLDARDAAEESEEEVADVSAASARGEAIDTPASGPELVEAPRREPEASPGEPPRERAPVAASEQVVAASPVEEPLARESSSGKLVGVLVIMLGVILLIAGSVVAALMPAYMIAGLSLTGVGALAAAIGLFLLTR